MLKFLRTLVAPVAKPNIAAHADVAAAPPAVVSAQGVDDFEVLAHLVDANGLPVLDWHAARQWIDGIADEQAQAEAWAACELAWLAHMRAALGQSFGIAQHGSAVLLSSLDAHVAQATLAFVHKTLQRVVRVLDGVAQTPAWGSDILIVFDDQESYYRYVAHYHAEAGEFARSSGMYIQHGCGHFVTMRADLQAIEPVIAHELTHSCLGHLPIPAWLNEGLAVNTERRLCPQPFDAFGHRPSPQQMHARHQAFWRAAEIQEFWSGQSFLRADDGNELSYDLARILVAQFASDWPRFQRFALAAHMADGGAAAAREHLGVELGEVAAALLGSPAGAGWAPDPRRWLGEPEAGAFRGRLLEGSGLFSRC
ncbi:MAG TPA: hypothetical protein VMS38_27255 [Pseudorhodoferax sp.]|nr:hypothetical protein [Pseudorhodoferax sp.]